MYNYKRNGFTLVELMAVIIIISLIALLTFPNIINQIKKTKKSNNKMIEDVVIEQAKKYVSDNPDDFQDKQYCFSIDTLVDKDYVKDEIVKINDFINKKVVYITNEGKYEYNIVDKDKCNTYDYVDNEGNGYYGLEYLESSGIQYIDTGYKPNQNTRVEINGNYTVSNGTSIFGSNPYFVITSRNATKTYVFRYNDILGETDYSVFSRGNIKLDNTGGYINGNKLDSWDEQSFQSPNSALIFARRSNSGVVEEKSYSRVYSCKIWENDELIKDYIPVKDENNVGCLYDKVEKKCEYSVGNEKLLYVESAYINYLQSTGTQYIDTGYKPNQNTRVEINGNYTISDGTSMFGSNPYFVITSRNATKTYVFRYNDILGETDYSVFSRGNIKLDKTGGYINGNKLDSWDEQSFQSPNSALIFARRSASGEVEGMSNSRVYSCKIWENDELVRDLVPYYKKDINKVGMLDKVHNVFYENQGTGEFLWG